MMARHVLAGIAGISAAFVWADAHAGNMPATTVNVTEGTAISAEPAEDEPGFDCHIHGNRMCGPLEDWSAAPITSDGFVTVRVYTQQDERTGETRACVVWDSDLTQTHTCRYSTDGGVTDVVVLK